jgi:hypothetical protein
MAVLRSYVVRFDSGFAPNPFYGYCTLATCKPDIRRAAQVDDWIVGSGSNDKAVRRGGYMVYAMRVGEILTFRQYDADPRFEHKKPYRKGSRKQSCGDNIYYRDAADRHWLQRDSFHSNADGSRHAEHVNIDTGVDRVLISQDFVYFGGEGPAFPDHLQDDAGRSICKSGIGHSRFDDPALIAAFEDWVWGLGASGFQGAPFEWLSLRGK